MMESIITATKSFVSSDSTSPKGRAVSQSVTVSSENPRLLPTSFDAATSKQIEKHPYSRSDLTKTRTPSLSMFTRAPFEVVAGGPCGEGTTMVLERYSSRANQGGKARDLHLTATFAFTCLLLPASREGGKKREKERSRGEKEASVLGFSLAKRPRGSGTTGKKDKENTEERDSREACCFFLKRDASLVEEKEGNSGRERDGEVPV
ncbi:hypothetical protein ALC60_03864 [Trachymyrmex zeteki]|uniref:Uncharacterized protein n=1 Tax=Mycetomoellerius zeteki TaxID=64791 RepID=A0A151XAA0_9HYME|nr:hypothetical protein ALC60_03864 [Trachymyrmex zeteki]